MFGETRADTLAMLEKLVGAVLHTGALLHHKGDTQSAMIFTTTRKPPKTHLLGRQRLAREILGAAHEASFDEARVELHKVLHLLLFDDLRKGRMSGIRWCGSRAGTYLAHVGLFGG